MKNLINQVEALIRSHRVLKDLVEYLDSSGLTDALLDLPDSTEPPELTAAREAIARVDDE